MCRSQIQGQNSFNFEQLRPRPPLAVATLVGSYGCPDTSYTLQVQPPTLPVLLCAVKLCMLILHFTRPDNSNTLRWPCWVCRCLQFAIFTLVVFRKSTVLHLIFSQVVSERFGVFDILHVHDDLQNVGLF